MNNYIIYRIYVSFMTATGRKGTFKDVFDVLKAQHLAGWTVYPTWGGWEDSPEEQGCVVELLDVSENTVLQVAETLRNKFSQQCVMLTKSTLEQVVLV